MNNELKLLPSYFTLKDFKFTNGLSLDEARVEYLTMGKPKLDDDGNIINAVVYCHGSSGNFSSIKRIIDLLAKDAPLSLDNYFFISLSSLGSPGSASPSNTGLKKSFPKYNVEDMVNFQRRFLREKFGIKHIKGLIGNSMGGFTVLTWAVNYPDEMDFIMSIVSSYKMAGHNYALSHIINEIIESDYYFKKELDFSSKRTLRLISEAVYPYGLSREMYRQMSNKEIDEAINIFADEAELLDLNDEYFRNIASMDYNVENKLKDICAKVLIIAINQDQYFPPNLDAIPMYKMIKNSKLVIFDSLMGHVGSNEIIKVSDEIKNFLEE